jgi:hypothetical protein
MRRKVSELEALILGRKIHSPERRAMNQTEMVTAIMRNIAVTAENHGDGQMTIGTLQWESLERAWRNIDKTYTPNTEAAHA